MKPIKVSPYEGLVTSEKQVVVLDIGYTYTKLGFSGEPSPRFIVPTTIRNADTGEVKNALRYADSKELYDNLVEFIHFLHFKQLLVSPKERKVIIVESLLATSEFREVLAKVLFYHMEVASVLFISSHMVALYPLAIPTALCFDLGYQEAVLIPVFEGYPVLHAYQAEPLGGDAVEANIRRLLIEYYQEKDPSKVSLIVNLPRKVIEDIKVRLCFVTTLERAQKLASNDSSYKPPPSVQYPIKGEYTITIDGRIRESACEVMFHLDGEEVSIATMILNAVLKCTIDMRKPLAENILLIGGTSLIPGIKSRLRQELDSLMKTPKYHNKLFVNEFQFHTFSNKEHYAAWLGGSIVGATEFMALHSIPREKYLDKKEIPDWANLAYNTRSPDSTRCQ